MIVRVDWIYPVPASLVGIWLAVRKGYIGMSTPIGILRNLSHAIEESLLVLRGLGVQTTTSSSTYLTSPTSRFIPTTEIQDIFIHEAFKGFEVRFYLAIVAEGEEDTVVVFPVCYS